MNHNELYTRWSLLNTVRSMPLPAKAKTETLILQSVYTPAVAAFEEVKRTIIGDSAEPDTEQKKAIDERALEDCGVADRRYTPAALEQIVQAVIDGNAPEGIDPEEFLSFLTVNLVQQD